jgi:hypothetical protein
MTALDDTLRGDRLKPAWLMYLESIPATRLWTGVGPFTLNAASGPDQAGGIYFGLGAIVQMPSLKIPLGGSYSGHSFGLSGVNQEMMTALNADAENVRGARLAWGRLELDQDGQPVGAPMWLWIGVVDSPRLTRDGTGTPPTRTISLIAATGAVRRRIRRASFWTSPQQRAIDPNDASCDQVSRYASGTDQIWPT